MPHPADTPEREQMRQSHAVTVVSSAQEGTDVQRLPCGVYGFTGAPGTPEMS